MTDWEPILREAGGLHDQAMGHATQARLLQAQGRRFEERACREELACLREAFELASKAASTLADSAAPEPSRAIIHRSAASLAVSLGDIQAARELLLRALAGRPDDRLRWELEDFLNELPIATNSRLDHSKTPPSPKQLLQAA